MIPETKVVYLDRFACLSSMRIGISREMAGKLIPFKVSRRATILESTEDKRVSFVRVAYTRISLADEGYISSRALESLKD